MWATCLALAKAQSSGVTWMVDEDAKVTLADACKSWLREQARRNPRLAAALPEVSAAARRWVRTWEAAHEERLRQFMASEAKANKAALSGGGGGGGGGGAAAAAGPAASAGRRAATPRGNKPPNGNESGEKKGTVRALMAAIEFNGAHAWHFMRQLEKLRRSLPALAWLSAGTASSQIHLR